MKSDVPLIIPEINAEKVNRKTRIVANPNCSIIIALMAVNPIHQINPIKRMIVSTYQAVSGAGNHGMEELLQQIDAIGHKKRS